MFGAHSDFHSAPLYYLGSTGPDGLPFSSSVDPKGDRNPATPDTPGLILSILLVLAAPSAMYSRASGIGTNLATDGNSFLDFPKLGSMRRFLSCA
jgi:hypothetical protein